MTVAVGLVVLASVDYFKTHRNAGEFYALLFLARWQISFVAASGNLAMIFIGLEFLTLTTAVSGLLSAGRPQVDEAAIKFFLFSVLSGGVAVWTLFPLRVNRSL